MLPSDLLLEMFIVHIFAPFTKRLGGLHSPFCFDPLHLLLESIILQNVCARVVLLVVSEWAL